MIQTISHSVDVLLWMSISAALPTSVRHVNSSPRSVWRHLATMHKFPVFSHFFRRLNTMTRNHRAALRYAQQCQTKPLLALSFSPDKTAHAVLEFSIAWHDLILTQPTNTPDHNTSCRR